MKREHLQVAMAVVSLALNHPNERLWKVSQAMKDFARDIDVSIEEVGQVVDALRPLLTFE